jgi:hypothetical protein
MTRKTKASEESSPAPTKKSKREGKLSLHPMEFEDALAVMLKTPPPPKDEPKGAKKRATKKRR